MAERTYHDDSGVRIRLRAHREYSERQVDFHGWVLAHIPRQGETCILDVGCGNGALFPHYEALGVRAVGLDRSPGMIARAHRQFPRVPVVVGTAERLPFPDASFDGVLAIHVLFLVQDIEAALHEAHRVLRPGGFFLASTNTEESQQALYEVHARALATIGRTPAIAHMRFPLEEGAERVRQVFGNARVDVLPNAFLFPSVEAAWTYYMSGIVDDVDGPPLTADERGAVGRVAKAIMEEIFSRERVWRVPKDAGVIVARKANPA